MIDAKKFWFVVRTNIKCEHKALNELQHLGIEVYLPEYKIERFNRRLRVSVVSTLCLFPRYLFANMSPDHLGAARACNGVEDVLPGRPRMPEPVSTADVLALRDAQDRMLLDDTDAARRRRGISNKNTLEALRKRLKDKRVRVIDGPFASFPGTIEAVDSLERLKVTIEIFGRPTPVELEFGQIEELAESRRAA
jgi:transcriptional antiterminator NusG